MQQIQLISSDASDVEVALDVLVADILDQAAQGILVGRVEPFIDERGQCIAEDAAVVLVARPEQRAARIRRETDRRADDAEARHVADLRADAERRLVDPPRRAELQMAGILRLEGAEDRADDDLVRRVHRTHDHLRQGLFAREQVEQRCKPLAVIARADAVKAGTAAEPCRHLAVHVAQDAVVELHDPAALRILLAEETQDSRLVLLDLLLRRRAFAVDDAADDVVELVLLRLAVDDAREGVVRRAAAHAREVGDTLCERFAHLIHRRDLDVRRLPEVVEHVVAPLRIGDVERCIRMEDRQHLHRIALLLELAMPLEVVLRMVRREDRRDIALLQKRTHGHHAVRELLRADRPDIVRRLAAQHIVAVEDTLEHEVDPRVDGVARRLRECLREILEALARRRLAARDEPLCDTIGPHETTCNRVVDQDLRQVVVHTIFRDIPHGDVCVVIEDRQFLSIFVIQVFCEFRVQEEIFVHKTFHDNQPRFPFPISLS